MSLSSRFGRPASGSTSTSQTSGNASSTSSGRRTEDTQRTERPGLSREELEELEEAFKLFDTQNTGLIDAAELKSAMESLGYKHKNKMVYNMIESLPSGMLSFDQFLNLMTARVSDTDSREDIAKVFRLFSDDSQYITVENLQRVARELGEPMSQAELREMIERADANGDHRIDFEEFYAIMTNKSFE